MASPAMSLYFYLLIKKNGKVKERLKLKSRLQHSLSFSQKLSTPHTIYCWLHTSIFRFFEVIPKLKLIIIKLFSKAFVCGRWFWFWFCLRTDHRTFSERFRLWQLILISNLFVDFFSTFSSIDHQNYYSKLLFMGDDSGSGNYYFCQAQVKARLCYKLFVVF